MKALTIRQPWADLIVSGHRHFEIRSWKPDYRGWLLIHAARKIDEEAVCRLGFHTGGLTLGAIVGKAFIEEYIPFTPENWQLLRSEHMEWTDFQPGLIGWRLSKAVKFGQPIPWNGSLGLFEIPDNVLPEETLRPSL
jgi:hypothetical protein